MNALTLELKAAGIAVQEIPQTLSEARENARVQGVSLSEVVHEICIAKWLHRAADPVRYAARCARRERVAGTPLAEHLDSEAMRGQQALQCDIEGRPLDGGYSAPASVDQAIGEVAEQQGKGKSSVYRGAQLARAEREAGQGQLTLRGGKATGRCPRPPRQSIGRVRRDLKRRPNPTGDLFGVAAEGGEV